MPTTSDPTTGDVAIASVSGGSSDAVLAFDTEATYAAAQSVATVINRAGYNNGAPPYTLQVVSLPDATPAPVQSGYTGEAVVPANAADGYTLSTANLTQLGYQFVLDAATANGSLTLGDNQTALITSFAGTGTTVTGGAGGGNNIIVGGGGNIVVMNGLTDQVRLAEGPDTVQGGTSSYSTVFGGTGDTTVFGSSGDGNTLFLSAGSNDVVGGTGSTRVITGSGADTITGGDGAMSIYGHTGAKLVNGGAGAITFVDSAGEAATVNGGATGPTLFGATGGDLTYGGTSGSLFVAASGNSTLTAANSGGGNTLFADANSNFTLAGNAGGASTYIAGAGAATVDGSGSAADNLFFAGSGTDSIGGGAGADTVVAGSGVFSASGGTGNDVFDFFQGHVGAANSDTITDFSGTDKLQLFGYGSEGYSTTSGGGNTLVHLSDNTTITLVGVTTLAPGQIVTA